MAVVLNTAASAVAKVLSVPVTAQLPPIFPPFAYDVLTHVCSVPPTIRSSVAIVAGIR
jgi:hypothetical protein